MFLKFELSGRLASLGCASSASARRMSAGTNSAAISNGTFDVLDPVASMIESDARHPQDLGLTLVQETRAVRLAGGTGIGRG